MMAVTQADCSGQAGQLTPCWDPRVCSMSVHTLLDWAACTQGEPFHLGAAESVQTLCGTA